MDPHVQMKRSSCQPLLHGFGAHPLLVHHPLIVVQQLSVQPVIVELCGLGHVILIVGDARDDAEVSVDYQADPGRRADSQTFLSFGSLSC